MPCCACMLKRWVIHVYLLSSCGIGLSRLSARISPPICLVSRDLWYGGSPPPLHPGMVTWWGRAMTWQVTWSRGPSSLSLTRPPTPQICLCMGGRGLRWPAACYGPGAISVKEDWVQGAPPHSHTQTSYTRTRDNTRRRVRVALYNRLFARSFITHRRGLGYKIPPWGKGLRTDRDAKCRVLYAHYSSTV